VRDQAYRITTTAGMTAVKPVPVFDQVNRPVKLIEWAVVNGSHSLVQLEQTARRQ
jgi:hypothetical protein